MEMGSSITIHFIIAKSLFHSDTARPTLNQPKFITATDRCNNARHRSSNVVSDNETLYNR